VILDAHLRVCATVVGGRLAHIDTGQDNEGD